ncbi:spore cortex-lytic enzyme [Bacillus sp. IB182487]|uniref:Spore cortex-lytic enzyme n=2 Tax=Metabacillus arenae TaxID=2771434 RepID=A0A926RVN2_9BACI|nr:spore cortex-lytic enzyme [Metabacillus arenae]MBD1378635.1 spore cortex-lytic enzyme [Metabacillus arenae]
MVCLIYIIFSCVLIFQSLPLEENKAYAFTNQVIQRGATGEDVVELQARLQYNGYYHGKIDGVYGWGTYWAARNFQQQFGLGEVDGLIGEKTKQKLRDTTKYYKTFVHRQLNSGKDFTHYGGIPLDQQMAPSKEMRAKARQQAEARRTKQGGGAEAQPRAKEPAAPKQAPKQQTEKQEQQEKQKTVAQNMPGGYSQNDIQLMANAVYGEARGEPYIGQVAIAAVILNRIESPTFPDTAAGVIYEPLAFTAVADGQINLTPNEQAKEAVLDAINGWDPTENATYYFNPNTATSSWIWGRPQIKKIGKHIFCE